MKIGRRFAPRALQFGFGANRLLLRALYRRAVPDNLFDDVLRYGRRRVKVSCERRKWKIRPSGDCGEISKLPDVRSLGRDVIHLRLFRLNLGLQNVWGIRLADIC